MLLAVAIGPESILRVAGDARAVAPVGQTCEQDAAKELWHDAGHCDKAIVVRVCGIYAAGLD